MKRACLTFLFLLCLQIFASQLFGQTSILNTKVTTSYQNVSLKEVLNDLQINYNITFSYSIDKISLSKTINEDFKNLSLGNVLGELFSGTGIVYEVLEGQIILKSKKIVQVVRGAVRDKVTQASLPGASVQIVGEGLQSGTITDGNGRFVFNKIPVGRKNVAVTFIGYETLIIENYVVTSGKEVVLEIELLASEISLTEIVVSGDASSKHYPVNPMAIVSARSFTPEETSRYPASFLDPSRMAQSYAGVNLYDDLNNDIVIRGNSSKGLLWKIEGIEVPNPNHFFDEGSTGGAISMLSNNVLDNSDFYTAAFPAEYGNALSGVFDLKFRKGNDKKREYALSTGILGTEVGLEGPFSKKHGASYLVNYRYSTIGILSSIGVNLDNVQAARFQDLSFNISIPFKRSTLSFFGLGGSSWGGEKAQSDTTLSKYLYYKINNDSRYLSGMTGIKYGYNFNNDLFWENIISFSGYKTSSNSDTLNLLNQPQLVDSDTFSNASVRFSSSLNFKASWRSVFKTGFIFSSSYFRFYSYQQTKSGEVFNYLRGEGNARLFQAFSQWKYNLSDPITLNTGLHLAYFNLSNHTSIEPRISIKYKVNERQQFTAGWGIHSRIEPLITYYNLKRADQRTVNAPNTQLKMTKAQHFVVGYNHSLSPQLRIKLEAYYQNLFNVPVMDDSTKVISTLNSVDGYTVYYPPVDTLYNKGSGKNFGIEVTFEKFFSNQYYFLAATSIYESRFKVPHFKEFSSSFNSNFDLSLVGGKEFVVGKEGSNVIGVNGKIVVNGGRRYTPIDLEKSISARETIYVNEKTNSLKTPTYYRFDMSFYFKINRKKITHSIYIDVQNVFNRRNIRTFLFDKNTNSIYTVYFNGILPNVYYKIQF